MNDAIQEIAVMSEDEIKEILETLVAAIADLDSTLIESGQ